MIEAWEININNDNSNDILNDFRSYSMKHDEIVIEQNNELIKKYDMDKLKQQERIELRSTVYSYLLDVNQDKFSIIEKFVYDTAKFHFKRLNLDFDESNNCIQFWFKTGKYNKCNDLHIDWNYDIDGDNKSALLSCISYFDDNLNPTVITNIDKTSLYNNSFDDASFLFSFPKKSTQITFEGGRYFHGMCDIFNNKITDDRNTLIVNLWDNNAPKNVPFFDSNLFDLEKKYDKETITVSFINTLPILDIKATERIDFKDKILSPKENSYYEFASILIKNKFYEYFAAHIHN
jgi:hypothetical protein